MHTPPITEKRVREIIEDYELDKQLEQARANYKIRQQQAQDAIKSHDYSFDFIWSIFLIMIGITIFVAGFYVGYAHALLAFKGVI